MMETMISWPHCYIFSGALWKHLEFEDSRLLCSSLIEEDRKESRTTIRYGFVTDQTSHGSADFRQLLQYFTEDCSDCSGLSPSNLLSSLIAILEFQA